MKQFLLVILMTAMALKVQAQHTRYEVVFTNKNGSPFSISNPSQFLSARALERRQRYNIAIDSSDLPVPPRYIDSLRAAGAVTVLNVSKWLNSATISTTDAAALSRIRNLPFVRSAKAIALQYQQADRKDEARMAQSQKLADLGNTDVTTGNFYNYGASYNQVHIHNGEFLHNIGLRGQGIIIGMLDAGYFNYTTLRAFDSVRAEKRILDTWDFVDREASVAEDHPHGMQCFSIIAANIPGSFVGTAPKASFYLYKTEDVRSEYPVEEHNWVVAAERVDSAGGDMISSSLGYTTFDDATFNYTYAQLNGRTAISSRGASVAARKGILVVNSAGNEGASSWRYISAPADADSILTVGAVTTSGTPATFSSYGPTPDGRVKPDVSSVGVATVIQGTNNSIVTGNGTSFSCPNMAGLAACLWQGFREVHPVGIIKVLQQAASRYPSSDNQLGYGIPDVRKATTLLLKQFKTSSLAATDCSVTLTWKSKDVSGMRYEIERRVPGDTAFQKVHIVNSSSAAFGPQNYQFTDNLQQAPAGKLVYRIRQVIDTAAGSFSSFTLDSLETTLARSCVSPGKNIVVIYPNPTRGTVNLKLTTTTSSDALLIRVVDVLGRTVYSVKKSKAAGAELYSLPTHTLPPGKYFVSVFDNENLLATTELIKL